MLPPARILALVLRWLALTCGLIAAVSGATILLHPTSSIGAATVTIAFAAAILLWTAGGFIDHWITRHARKRLQSLLATAEIQGSSLPGTHIEPDKRRMAGKLQLGRLATVPSARSAE